mgnify:CR=1 FL=1
MPNDKMPFVVLRSNDNCFLDIIRACATAGITTIPVIFTWEGAEWISESSVYFKNAFTICNPAVNEDKAVEDLCRVGHQLLDMYGERLMIIPSSDTNQSFLQNNFDSFSPFFLQMGAADFDKPCLKQLRKDTSSVLLKETGVEIPLTYGVCSALDIDNAVNNITYPCIYKPVIKDLVSSFQNTHGKKKAIECYTPEELRICLKKEMENGYELVVQEKIEFDSLEDEVSCYVYADKKGMIRLISGQHKVLEYPHPYGTGVASVPYYRDEFFDIAKRVVAAYKWRGFIGIELMKNRNTGRWVVIETNLRPWISINYQASIGYNYLEALYKDIYGGYDESKDFCIFKDNLTTRINLTMLINMKIAETNNIENALSNTIAFIENKKGQIIFSYYVDNDKNPGLAEKEKLIFRLKEYDLAIDKIYELVEQNNAILSRIKTDEIG